MATVKVAYKELESTAKKLVGLKEYAQSVLTELAKSEADIEKTSSLHDNCFAATLDALADLEHAFTNYYNEIDFLIRQCNNAFEAFSTAEADSEKQAGVIKDLISLAGLEETVNASDVEVKSGETLDDVGKDNKRASSKKTSETWNRAFEDTDLDGVYDEIHGTKAKKADSIVGDTGEDKKEEVSEDATTDTDSNQSNNYNNNSSSGGGNNNRIQKRHKEVESIKDDKKDDKKKDKKEDKKEQKKTDPIEEKEVKE
ncbi:MAG: hypothetical protein IKE63_03460 [Bacilli bacterium]|nr:hypothetical protein [Bacilli bacterium]